MPVCSSPTKAEKFGSWRNAHFCSTRQPCLQRHRHILPGTKCRRPPAHSRVFTTIKRFVNIFLNSKLGHKSTTKLLWVCLLNSISIDKTRNVSSLGVPLNLCLLVELLFYICFGHTTFFFKHTHTQKKTTHTKNNNIRLKIDRMEGKTADKGEDSSFTITDGVILCERNQSTNMNTT